MMDTTIHITQDTKEEQYKELLPQIASLLEGETDWLANMANCISVLKMTFPVISWIGFYLVKKGELVLGPFQGKPACTRLLFGKGVCGTAAQELKTVIVPDVNQFPGHIFCDTDSLSEIVVPVFGGGRLIGVLDIDSHLLASFDEVDRRYLEQVVQLLEPSLTTLESN